MKAGKIKYGFEFVGGNTIVIRRSLPDKSEKFVGSIIREMCRPSGTVVFKSFDWAGNEILPPKDNFGEAAVLYENHLKSHERKVKNVAKPTRQTQLKNIRKKKVQKRKGLQR